jgi:hypothetical protein
VLTGSPKNFKVSTEREKKFGRSSETAEGFCHVMPVTGLKRSNIGKDDDDDKGINTLHTSGINVVAGYTLISQ